MNLPKFALEHKPIVLGFALLLLIWGLNVFLTAPRREDPEFLIREAVVNTEWPGATAQQVEELVTDKVEVAAANIKQVRRVQSTSSVGKSTVQVTTIDDVTDTAAIWAKLRAEMALIVPDLPEGASHPAVDDNFGDTAALILAMYQDPESAERRRYTPKEMEILARRLRDRLMDIRPTETDSDGRIVPITTAPAYVARLDLYGVQREVIYLETDAGVWSQLQLTTDELQQLLAQRNVIAPAGTFNTATDRVHTRLSGNFDAAREIDSVVVGRVASGAETPGRQTLAELKRDIEAGEGVDAGRPSSFEVPVYLDDLRINVTRGYADPPETLVRFANSDISADAIALSFTMKSGTNITWLGDEVARLLETQRDTFLPPDIVVHVVSDPPFFVEKKISDVVNNLIEAVVLVLLILGLLAGPRVALVTAASVPLIMLSSLALMRIWDVEIEQISLAALIVSLGLLVDNAIVTCENTTQFLNRGMDREQAVIEGCNQVGTSLLWSSLTTISVFIPMTFALPADIGEYVFSLPVVVTLTLTVSWLCAMTVTPILNYYVLRPTDGRMPLVALFAWIRGKLGGSGSREEEATSVSDEGAAKPGAWYVPLCRFAMAGRIPTIGVAFALLVGALALPVKPSFFPFSDRNQFTVDLWVPTTSPIYRTNEVAKQVETLLQRLSSTTWQDGEWVPLTDEDGEPVQRLNNMLVYVGTGGARFYTGLDPGPQTPRFANIIVNARSYDDVDPFVADIRRGAWAGVGEPGSEDYLPPIAGARVVPRQLVMGTPVPSPIEYRLHGPRLGSEKVLRYYGNQMKDVLRDSGYVWDVHDSWGELGFQYDVNLKSAEANMAGVTNDTVAHTLNAYYSGFHLTTFREGDRQLPVMLRLPPEQRRKLENVESAFVEGYTGKVPLNSVADFELTRVPVEITRYQRERAMRIRARPEPGLLARDILLQLKPQMDAIEAELPPGYRIENGGIEEEALKGERGNATSLMVGLVLVVFCLLLQYNSAIKPLLVLLTVPLSIIGAMLGLWIRDIPMGFMETLGFLALFGTVLNAAILLIDFTEQLIRQKLADRDGIAPPGERSYCGLTREAFRATLAEAGRARLMPIFLTTATTVAGLTSLMFGGGPLFKGLATAFASGLIVGSAITLFVLPALMALFVENFRFQLVKPPEPEDLSPEPAPAAAE